MGQKSWWIKSTCRELYLLGEPTYIYIYVLYYTTHISLVHLNITVQLWSVSSLWDLYSILSGISIFCDTINEWAFLPILIMPLSILLLFSFLLLWVIGRWRRGRVVAALRVTVLRKILLILSTFYQAIIFHSLEHIFLLFPWISPFLGHNF